VLRGSLSLSGPPAEAEDDEASRLTLFERVIDDVVEDGFKLVCVRAHYAVGGLLGASLRRAILQSTALPVARHAASVAAEAVRFGTVAGRYCRCDEYGDRLGDTLQQAVIDVNANCDVISWC